MLSKLLIDFSGPRNLPKMKISGARNLHSEMISGPRNCQKMMISGPRKLHNDQEILVQKVYNELCSTAETVSNSKFCKLSKSVPDDRGYKNMVR